jgi:hypothetical protein
MTAKIIRQNFDEIFRKMEAISEDHSKSSTLWVAEALLSRHIRRIPPQVIVIMNFSVFVSFSMQSSRSPPSLLWVKESVVAFCSLPVVGWSLEWSVSPV